MHKRSGFVHLPNASLEEIKDRQMRYQPTAYRLESTIMGVVPPGFAVRSCIVQKDGFGQDHQNAPAVDLTLCAIPGAKTHRYQKRIALGTSTF